MTPKLYARPLAVLAVAISLGACGARHDAKAAVRKYLKDPDSAKFGEFYYNTTTKKACFEVNAKNSMGGYTGTAPLELDREENGWRVLGDTPFSMAQCKSYWADGANPPAT